MTNYPVWVGALFLGLLLAPPSASRIVPNDNRAPAGTLAQGRLTIGLVVQRGDWYPEADNGPHLTVAAFAEEGKAPSIPGPLIRVPTGTLIQARIRNALPDSTIYLIGFSTQPIAASETLQVAPGSVSEVTFQAGQPGTYYYRAVIGQRSGGRDGTEHETAGGAFVVDPPGGSPPDRIFVMNIFAEPADSTGGREALTINGKSWPHTERQMLTVGDTARWRVINGSIRPHPMHLHGFYFRVDAEGNGLSSRDLPAGERALAVTEFMRPWTTRTFTWSPDRPGNWLFHCHLTFHVVPDARLGHNHSTETDVRETTSINPMQHMAGLVLGIQVAPRPGEPPAGFEPARRLDLFVHEGKGRGRMPRTFSYILQEGEKPPASDSVLIPGSLIVLTRGEPTDITVHNRASEPVGVHWHGLELESWSDGVAGWSGIGSEVAPPIFPADSFTAHLSLPRAGTFIYHTHINDIEQVTSGAIGPLVVLEPNQRFNPARDHVYIGGWSGMDDVTSPGCVPPQSEPKCWPRLMVNGDTLGLPPLVLQAGVPHRFRFINLSPAQNIRYALRRDTTAVQWIAQARDGADLPMALQKAGPAMQAVSVGQTFDFVVTPQRGELVLTAGFAGGEISWRQRLIFR